MVDTIDMIDVILDSPTQMLQLSMSLGDFFGGFDFHLQIHLQMYHMIRTDHSYRSDLSF